MIVGSHYRHGQSKQDVLFINLALSTAHLLSNLRIKISNLLLYNNDNTNCKWCMHVVGWHDSTVTIMNWGQTIFTYIYFVYMYQFINPWHMHEGYGSRFVCVCVSIRLLPR